MQKYAKLTDCKIEFAPQNKGAISNYNLSVELMTADGYKPLIVIEEPTAEKPLVKYQETDKQIEQYAEGLSVEQKQAEIRTKRDRMIDASDWRVSRNNDERELGLTETDNRELLLKYREYLRNYPETEVWWEHSPKDFLTWKEMLTEEEWNEPKEPDPSGEQEEAGN